MAIDCVSPISTIVALCVAGVLPILVVIAAYIVGELGVYERGGDVYDWTVSLANFLKRWK